jgi:hypothetical protein
VVLDFDCSQCVLFKFLMCSQHVFLICFTNMFSIAPQFVSYALPHVAFLEPIDG